MISSDLLNRLLSHDDTYSSYDSSGTYTLKLSRSAPNASSPSSGGVIALTITVTSFSQPSNAFSPIFLIVFGISISNNELHPANALSPISSVLSESFTVSSAVSFSAILALILVTFSGNCKDLIDLFSANAATPIFSIFSL